MSPTNIFDVDSLIWTSYHHHPQPHHHHPQRTSTAPHHTSTTTAPPPSPPHLHHLHPHCTTTTSPPPFSPHTTSTLPHRKTTTITTNTLPSARENKSNGPSHTYLARKGMISSIWSPVNSVSMEVLLSSVVYHHRLQTPQQCSTQTQLLIDFPVREKVGR
ncbi:hypothetical protein Hanom_Chr03g00207531 [Helianthus anomalus]